MIRVQTIALQPNLSAFDEQFLEKMIAIIEQNVDNDSFSVATLGNILNMSRSTLFRKVKHLTGQKPIDIVIELRMLLAKKLLLEQQLSVSQISYEVGFKTASSFTKSFKKKFGKSPSHFLKDQQQQQIDEFI